MYLDPSFYLYAYQDLFYTKNINLQTIEITSSIKQILNNQSRDIKQELRPIRKLTIAKIVTHVINYNRRQKLLEQLRKTASYLTPQVMNNQFKRPSPWGLRQLYYIYLTLRIL